MVDHEKADVRLTDQPIMPESLTRVAGFNRNGGRNQIGIPGRLLSEPKGFCEVAHRRRGGAVVWATSLKSDERNRGP